MFADSNDSGDIVMGDDGVKCDMFTDGLLAKMK